MSRFKNRLIAAAVLALLAGIGTIMNSRPSALQAAGGPTVTIDQAQLPLPIQGSVSLGGTVAASQSGLWNVGIAGTPNVNVANSASNPVLTRAVDNPGLEPFQFQQTGGNVFFSFGVPSGKTLVIENVSIVCSEPPAPTGYFTDFRLITIVNGVLGGHLFAPTQISASTYFELITDQVTHIYASGGTTVSIGDGAGAPSGSTCGATISGHLVASL